MTSNGGAGCGEVVLVDTVALGEVDSEVLIQVSDLGDKELAVGKSIQVILIHEVIHNGLNSTQNHVEFSGKSVLARHFSFELSSG